MYDIMIAEEQLLFVELKVIIMYFSTISFMQAMAAELQRLFPSYKVEIHQGSIHVNGDLREEVKTWLTHLGF